MAAASVLAKKKATASHFGNGGEVANLLSEAKLRKEKRRGDGSVESRRGFSPFRRGVGARVYSWSKEGERGGDCFVR